MTTQDGSFVVGSGRRPEYLAEQWTKLGLPPASANELVHISRLVTFQRNARLLTSPGSSFILCRGIVTETMRQPDRIRVWREFMLLGHSHTTKWENVEDRAIRGLKGSMVVCRTNCTMIHVMTRHLRQTAQADPSISALVADLTASRHETTEHLYTASRATPLSRVAALLNYLTTAELRVTFSEQGDARLSSGYHTTRQARGPSRAEIADSLGLGKATVEKALVELRSLGALGEFGPEGRENRTYPVASLELLQLAASGGVLA